MHLAAKYAIYGGYPRGNSRSGAEAAAARGGVGCADGWEAADSGGAGETEQQIFAKRLMEPLELESLDSYRFYVRSRVRDFGQRESECEARVAEQRQK